MWCTSIGFVRLTVGYAPDVAVILEVQLQRRPTSSGLARDAARRVLDDVCDLQQLGDVLTVISELVTNAVRHTGGGCTLVLSHDGDKIVVEVRDSDTRAPQRTRDDGGLGHGLGVVQSLASRWGIDRLPEGKCVWAELTVGAPTASTSGAVGAQCGVPNLGPGSG